MRAKLPATEGFVERDGVKLHYEVYGQGPETMVFLPPWSIVHSRVYKAQLPYFSERFRCIAFDGRGNGKSDRPADVAAYSLENCIADILAVMDATDAGRPILVGLSSAACTPACWPRIIPERVKAAILAGTVAAIGPGYPLHGAASISRRSANASRAGTNTIATTGWLELSRLRRAFHPQHLLRAAFDQADRGRHRMGRRDHRPRAGQDRGGAGDPAARSTSARPCIAGFAAPCC